MSDLVFGGGECDCPTLVVRGKINHYDKEKDRLFSVFDDFGYITYKDSEDNLHKLFGHHHLGVVESYKHACCEDPKEGWEYVKFEQDNSVIPQIKEWFLKNMGTESNARKQVRANTRGSKLLGKTVYQVNEGLSTKEIFISFENAKYYVEKRISQFKGNWTSDPKIPYTWYCGSSYIEIRPYELNDEKCFDQFD